MAAPTIAGFRLLEAEIYEPRQGVWHADVQADTGGAEITGAVVIAFGTQSWAGSVYRGGVESGRWLGRIVGGAGGLSRELDAKGYRSTPLQIVLDDVMLETGETLSADALSLASHFVAHWQRTNRSASGTLDDVAAETGSVWRVGRDGDVWLGSDAFTEVLQLARAPIEDADPSLGFRLIAPELPELRPAVTFEGERVEFVRTQITQAKLRQYLWAP